MFLPALIRFVTFQTNMKSIPTDDSKTHLTVCLKEDSRGQSESCNSVNIRVLSIAESTKFFLIIRSSKIQTSNSNSVAENCRK